MNASSSAPAPSGRITLEIAIESIEDAVVAHRHGADRLELSADLNVDGLTPLIELVTRIKRDIPLPLMVMIRPRSGGFCYDSDELAGMRTATERAIAGGADGIVFGCLRDDGTIDAGTCDSFMGLCCGGTEAVFHRAFDLTPDPFRALEQLIELGFTRVLTAGGARGPATSHADVLRGLMERAAGRIEILPAGGIRPHNAAALIRATGCTQIHSSCRSADAETPLSADDAFGRLGTDANLIADLRRVVDSLE